MSSFYPTASARATSQLGITRLLFQINHDQLSIQDLQTQLSTGRRISKPSQDPAAAIRALTAQRQLEFKSQLDDNLKSADSLLSVTESTLAQAQTLLNEMRGLAVSATGNTFSEEERDAFIAQVSASISKLTELGNAKFRDQFIFGGSDILQSPLAVTGGGISFKGNEEQLRTITDFASTVAANISAEEAFGVRSDRVVGTVDLNPAISGETPLSQLNRGEGIRGGAISFSNGIEKVEVDLSNAYDLNDVLDRINATSVDGRALSATLTTNGLNVEYADTLPGILAIDEVGSGIMAAGLGIANGATGLSPVVGTDLNPLLSKETRLSQLLGGVGITIGDTFQITQGDETHIIGTNGLVTVEDFINRIHQSGADVIASIDSTGKHLAIQSTESGTRLSIGENNQNLATQLGIRTLGGNTSVSELNFGRGIFASEEHDDLVLIRSNGTEFAVDLDGVQSVQDVIDRINNNVDNFSPGTRIQASLNPYGNGFVLTAPAGAQQIGIKNAGGSQAAWGLGLVASDQTESRGTTVGSSSVIRGADVSGVEVEGVFTSLIRFRETLESGRFEDMERIAAILDDDLQRMSLARGLVGTRQQSIQYSEDLSAEQQLLLKEIESQELDADLAQVISELSSREAALQASLQLMGQANRLTLFDYL